MNISKIVTMFNNTYFNVVLGVIANFINDNESNLRPIKIGIM